MAENAWERYKREHGLDKQEQTKATETKSTENAWERFKREHGTMESNPNFRQDLYAENQKAKQQREQRSNLNARRRELESTAPTVTGNRDAEWADYYSNMLNYAAETGDRSLYYDNLSKYKAASEKVSGQYASQMARHNAQDAGIDKIFGLGDKLGFGNYNAKAKEQERRYDLDAGFYQQMANDAQLMGNQDLYNKAAKGYGESYARYMRAYDEAYNADMQHLQENAPDLYIAHTATDEDVNAKLEDLKQRREEAKARAEALDKELNDLKMSGQITSIDSHGVASYGQKQREANAANAEVLALDKEIETYTKAARVQKNNRGAALYEQYLGGGKVLDPETFKKIDAGKARYEADRKAAIAKGDETLDYGLNFFAKARGVWRGDKDRLEEAGWDSTFDTAPNLTSEDKNLFYALYADDPQKAMDFITYANNRRNEEYESWMAEWAHENGWNTAGAFFQALGNRIGSGVVNLADPHSAAANQLAQTSSGLLSGGSQLLNKWSGTIDTDIPILRDIINGKGLGDFYQLANSILESGINAYAAGKFGEFIPGGGAEGIGALGVMLMGSSASAADYNESIKRGLTPGEAQKHALAAGINEALFEFVSLDKLVDTEKLLQAGTIGKEIKAIFIQSGVEASEEFCTTVANRLADAAQARRDGYDSQIENRAKELIALGMSRDEALEKAEKEWLTDLINDAIGGFISGGFHDAVALAVTAPARAVSYVRGERAANQAAGATSTNEQQAAMRAYAEANGIEWRTAENAAQAVKQAETATQNAENAEQQEQTQEQQTQEQAQEQPMTRQEKRQERREEKAQAKSEREIGADVRRVQEHIDKQLAGKSVQEQTAIRDKLVQQYGEAIAPAVYSAVRTNAYQQAAQNANPTAIQAAKEAALEGVTDQEMRRAVSSAYDQAAVNLALQTKNTDALGRYYQQIRGTGTGNMTMEAIVKGNDGQETRSAITGMSEDGKSVTLADGSTVAVKELQADADTMDIIHEISALGLGKNTDKVFQAYKKSGKTGLDGYRWIMDYTTAIDQGRNRRISLQEAIKRSSLDAETVMEAYEMGHKETMDETRKAVQKNENRPKRKGVTGRVANIDTSAIQNEPMSKGEREQFDLANQIFELLGVDVKWESSKTRNGKYVGANGSYLNGVVTLDIHAGRNYLADINSGILATTGHELTHFLQEYAPEQYQASKEFVLQQIVKNGKYGEATLDRMIHDKQNRSSKKLTKSQAEDEIVADACQTMLRDSKALREFAEQKPEAAKGIIQWLADWFKKIKAAFSRSAQLSEQARFMEKLEKDVREAFGKLWDDALREAVRVHDEIGDMESAVARDIEETGASAQIAEEAIVQNSDRIDAETQRFLDNQDHVTVYRAMQLIDGKLYPPMAAKVEGKLVEPTEIGKWYQSVERPDLVKNGKFTLNKGNGSSIAAAYNPYFHCSASPLNDQFSSAYKRPNLVVVEGIIPSSELTSGYKAEGAKNAVGETTWHAGPVASKLKGDKARRVFLSRYFQVSRIMTDGEVADIIAKTLQGENVKIPSNVVTPGLLEALQERGVAIENNAQNSDRDYSITQTKQFKRWFDGSVVTNEDGSPRIVYHQTAADFWKFSTDNPVAGNNDSETPNGIFFKDNDHDIGLGGNRQIAAYLSVKNPLHFANREEANRWYQKHIDGYAQLQKEMQEKLKPFDNELQRLEDSMFGEDVTDEQYEAIDAEWNAKLEEMKKVEDSYRGRLREMLNDYFLNGNSQYDGIILDYDGHRYVNGKRENVKTYIVFDGTQVKSADPVTYDDQGNVIPVSERFNPEQEDIRYSTRDYDTPSDLELMEQAAEWLTEAGSAAYWESLLQSAPDLAGDKAELAERARDYKAQAKKLEKITAELAEAKRNLTLTNRKLNTKGIFPMVQGIMKDMAAGDVNGLKVNKNVEKILIDAYQKAMDQIDEGADAGTAWETVYNEGVVKAVDYMMENATVSEKIGFKWEVSTMEKRYGAEGRQYLLNLMTGKVAEDFAANRYRAAIQETEADRLVERTEKQMQKKVDAQKSRVSELKAQNEALTDQKERMENDLQIWRESHRKASEQVTFLNERLQETRKELRESNKLSAKERKAKHEQAQRLEAQLKAKRTEANAWKALAERNEALLRAAMKSKNADLDALRVQMDRQATEAQKRQAKIVQELADQKQREADILAGKLKPLAMQRLLKAVREEAAEKATAHKEEVFQRYKERKEAAAIRNRISNLKAELQRRLTNPTDRSYVPAELATSMVDLLDALDTSPREGTQAAAKYQTVSEGLRALAEAYNSLTTDETVGWEYKSEYDEEIRDQIKELSKTMQGRNIRELSLEELQQVYDAVKAIRDSMRQATKLLNTNQFRDIYEAIQSIVDQQKRMTPIADVGWKERNKRRRLLEGLSVMRAVEMMSGWERDSALYSMFQGVEQGQVDADNWIMGYDKAMRPLKTGKNEKAYRDALTKQMDFGATDKESGKTVKMTKLQAIQLYMTWQREQANDKLVHLQKGGATIRDAIAIQNGKGSKAASHTVRVTPELISNIENSLTEWDRAYMKEIRGYLDKEAKAVNRVLYALKHRVLTTEAAYMPYVVDKGYLETKLEGSDVFNLFVKTPGSTQALQKKAPQPVIIDGLDNMMARHVRDQAQYIGLALPIRDFAKVFNGRLSSEDGDVYTSLKKTIEDNFEAGGTHLLVQALLDIQNSGVGEAWQSQIAAALNRLHSSFVKAALLINPSVTIKQAASYIAAESVLSHTALERGNHPIWTSTDKSKAFMPGGLIAHLFNSPEGRTAQRLYEEIDAHTSMHYIRRQGMSHAELANEAQRDGRIKRAVNAVGARMEQNKAGHVARKAGEMLNPLTWIQRMDVATTATLWVACKEQAKLDGMKTGTTEYWNRVTELYERCLRETQPMYDGLHRTAHQKQGGGLMQYLFPFRTVPVQNHGQIVAAYETMKAMKGQSKEKQAAAKKFFAKTVWSQTQSAVVFSLMTFLAAALKRKTKKYRDEDEEFTLESFLEGLGGDTASTLFSVAFPMWGSEAWSAGSRIFDKIEGTSGYSYDAFTVGAVDMLNELSTAGDKLFADVGKIMRGEDVSGSDVWDHVLGLMTKGAKIAGIPADTVKTYYAGIKANVQDAIEGRIPALNDETWERATAVNANRFYKAWGAGDAEKMQTVLDEVKASGKSEESISSAFHARAKEAYEAGEISLEEYAEYLEKTGMFDGEKISGKIKTILKAEFTAGSRSEDETIDALITYCGMDEDKAWETVQKWEGNAEHPDDEDYSWSKYDDLRAAIDANQDISGIVAELTAHGSKEKDIKDKAKEYIKEKFVNGEITEDKFKNWLARYCGITNREDAAEIVNDAKCKRDTGYTVEKLGEGYRAGDVGKTDAKTALTKYGGLTGTDADKKIRWWDQQKAHPDLQITEGACNNWYDGSAKTRENGHESAKAAGMSLEAYLAAKKELDKITDANGNSTGEDEYIAALAKMNLTPRQKDALYYEKYKGTTKYSTAKSW